MVFLGLLKIIIKILEYTIKVKGEGSPFMSHQIWGVVDLIYVYSLSSEVKQ
jgi:hypothetical protein